MDVLVFCKNAFPVCCLFIASAVTNIVLEVTDIVLEVTNIVLEVTNIVLEVTNIVLKVTDIVLEVTDIGVNLVTVSDMLKSILGTHVISAMVTWPAVKLFLHWDTIFTTVSSGRKMLVCVVLLLFTRIKL